MAPIRWHEEDTDLLRAAITFTAAQSGFAARLLEKDYFCSVVLEYLSESDIDLVFKGGTCLAKIHSGFYRLSEDLDFSIPVAVDASRGSRRALSSSLKVVIAELPTRLPAFSVTEPLAGANNSTQYTVAVGYESLLDSHLEPVRIEVGLREPLLDRSPKGMANTALLNPLNGRTLVDAFPVHSLSYREAMAEKLRAALCRREVAIRDFFDIDYAARQGKLDLDDPELISLLQEKIRVPGSSRVDISTDRMSQLQRQIDAQLGPVLAEDEYQRFDLDRAIEIVCQAASKLAD